MSKLNAALLKEDGWRQETVNGGAVLWREGDPADHLVWIQEGAISVEIDGRPVLRAGPGALLGEVSVFVGDGRRLGQAMALGPTTFMSLTRLELDGLRSTGADSYSLVLRAGIEGLAERVEVARARAHARARRSSPPSAAALSATLPGFAGGDGTIVDVLRASIPSRTLAPGVKVCAEGDAGRSLFIVEAGELQLSADGWVRAIVGPGSVLDAAGGLGAIRRPATATTHSAVTLFELDAGRIERLPHEARRAVHETLLALLRDSLVAANAGLKQQASPPPEARGARPELATVDLPESEPPTDLEPPEVDDTEAWPARTLDDADPAAIDTWDLDRSAATAAHPSASKPEVDTVVAPRLTPTPEPDTVAAPRLVPTLVERPQPNPVEASALWQRIQEERLDRNRAEMTPFGLRRIIQLSPPTLPLIRSIETFVREESRALSKRSLSHLAADCAEAVAEAFGCAAEAVHVFPSGLWPALSCLDVPVPSTVFIAPGDLELAQIWTDLGHTVTRAPADLSDLEHLLTRCESAIGCFDRVPQGWPAADLEATFEATGHRLIRICRGPGAFPFATAALLCCPGEGLASALIGPDVVHGQTPAQALARLGAWAKLWSAGLRAPTDSTLLASLGTASAPQVVSAQAGGPIRLAFPHGERWLHPNFVAALLYDLFGIEVGICRASDRASVAECLCLAFDSPALDALMAQLAGASEHHPGLVELSVPPGASALTLKYIGEALALVGASGWAALADYRLHDDGTWSHQRRRRWPSALASLHLEEGALLWRSARLAQPEDALNGTLTAAKAYLQAATRRDYSPQTPEGQWFASP